MFSSWKKVASPVAANRFGKACATPEEKASQVPVEVRLSLLEADLAQTRQQVCVTRRQVRVTWAIACCASVFAFVLGANPEARAQFGVTLTSLDSRLKAVEAKTASISAVTDPNTNQPTVRFTGVNVQVVSGSGSTDGAVTGTGNLIIGYNELRGGSGTNADIRTGSHSLIVGLQNNYSAYGGIVAGANSQISGIYANVTGGLSNTASGQYSSVSGGVGNTASGQKSSISGGALSVASGTESSILGGRSNTASSFESSISGGAVNSATGIQASVTGGDNNTASGNSSTVSGGSNNAANGFRSTVSGGFLNTVGASGDGAAVSGGGGVSINSYLGWGAGSQTGNSVSGNFSSP